MAEIAWGSAAAVLHRAHSCFKFVVILNRWRPWTKYKILYVSSVILLVVFTWFALGMPRKRNCVWSGKQRQRKTAGYLQSVALELKLGLQCWERNSKSGPPSLTTRPRCFYEVLIFRDVTLIVPQPISACRRQKNKYRIEDLLHFRHE